MGWPRTLGAARGRSELAGTICQGLFPGLWRIWSFSQASTSGFYSQLLLIEKGGVLIHLFLFAFPSYLFIHSFFSWGSFPSFFLIISSACKAVLFCFFCSSPSFLKFLSVFLLHLRFPLPLSPSLNVDCVGSLSCVQSRALMSSPCQQKRVPTPRAPCTRMMGALEPPASENIDNYIKSISGNIKYHCVWPYSFSTISRRMSNINLN